MAFRDLIACKIDKKVFSNFSLYLTLTLDYSFLSSDNFIRAQAPAHMHKEMPSQAC